MDRSEHLEWCKDRASTWLDIGDVRNAYTSMVSDLRKHPETETHPAIFLGVTMMAMEQLNTVDAMRKFIEGFN